ncbi:MAG: carbohydrate kinase family protein [Candidatus Latescibacteria bacterium]|nr:carbohydrate kinase family protein [Candidatus Latescibacterota bacterium]
MKFINQSILNDTKQNGIGFVGSVIVDVVSEILEPGNLVYADGAKYLSGEDYESEDVQYSIGGMCTNNSIDCAKMGAKYPICVLGKIGLDENGSRIRDFLKKNGISDEFLMETHDHPTSVTHVLYVRDSSQTINRTFRYYFGAMGDFYPENIDYDVLRDLKIVMVGYGLLMPRFDIVDVDYGTQFGRVFEKIQTMGITTCLDLVTPKRDRWWKFKRFRKTLKWVDILSIGEDQAEGITGISDEQAAVKSLVEDYGVTTAVVHCGDKGTNYLYSASTGMVSQRIFDVPPEEYAGNTGAGDAFTSGLLHGIHNGWELPHCLKYATAAAAVSLGSLTTTDAMRHEDYIIEYMETRPLK